MRLLLALSLLVLWVLANNPYNAVAADDLALLAPFLDRSLYFHLIFLSGSGT
jgi:hypothetical protein